MHTTAIHTRSETSAMHTRSETYNLLLLLQQGEEKSGSAGKQLMEAQTISSFQKSFKFDMLVTCSTG